MVPFITQKSVGSARFQNVGKERKKTKVFVDRRNRVGELGVDRGKFVKTGGDHRVHQ